MIQKATGRFADPEVDLQFNRVLRFLNDNVAHDQAFLMAKDDYGRVVGHPFEEGGADVRALLATGRIWNGQYYETVNSSNIVDDPHFNETAATDDDLFWDFDGSDKVWASNAGYNGGPAAQILTTGSAVALTNHRWLPVHNGDRFYITTRLKGSAGHTGNAKVYLTAYDSDKTPLGYSVGSSDITVPTSWEQWATFVELANANVAYVRLSVEADGTGEVYFDDIEIQRMPTKMYQVGLVLGDTWKVDDYVELTATEVLNEYADTANPALSDWSHNLVFSSPASDKVDWTAGTIVLSNGDSYSISLGTTGNMSTDDARYIYLDTVSSPTSLSVTTVPGSSVGAGKILVAVAQRNTSGDAEFQVFGGRGGLLIGANSISANSIAANHISAGTITSSHLDADSVTAAKIAADAIEAGHIAAGQVDTTHLATYAVTTTKIAANAITAGKIAANSVDTSQLVAGAVTANEIEADAVTASKIAVNSVSAGHIAANSVNTSELMSGAVTTDILAANAVTATKIAAGIVDTVHLAADSITAAKIASLAVDTEHLAADAVTALKVAAGAIEAGHISANAITAAKIASLAIDTTHLAADAVTAAKIATGAVEAGHIAANAVTAGKIAANSVDTSELAADAVTANEIASNVISASHILGTNFGTLTISSGKIRLNTADALEVMSSGSMKLLAGSDVSLENDGVDPAVIYFVDASNNTEVKISEFFDIFTISPPTNVSGITCKIGQDVNAKFDDIQVLAGDSISLEVVNASGSIELLRSYSTDESVTLDSSGFYADPNNTVDLGLSSKRWKTTYTNDLNVGGAVTINGGTDLDEYERGTWNPTISGVSLSTSVGRYVRVGDLVVCWGRLSWGTVSGTPNFNIGGLPFAATSVSSLLYGGCVTYWDGEIMDTSGQPLSPAAQDIHVYKSGTNNLSEVSIFAGEDGSYNHLGVPDNASVGVMFTYYCV